jgi:outer membrane protein assembly factor BamB
MLTRRPFLIFIVLMSVPARAATDSSVAHWPQFRGALGAGVAGGAKPPVKFGPTEGVRWNVEVPWSPSSPCVWGDRIFLTTLRDGELETRCHGRADGRLLWSRALKPTGLEVHHRSDGSPAASTPATDGRRVVSYFGSFGLVCHDFDGKELWRHPLPLAESLGQYGSGTSPIIVGERVLLSRDQEELSALLALDVHTGKLLWSTSRPDSAGGFSTPVVWRNDGVDEVVIAGSSRLKGYDLKTGEERWKIEGVTRFVCPSAVVADGWLYFGAFSNGQADSPFARWEVWSKNYDKNGDGVVEFTEVPAEKRDYLRGLDRNRDGRFTKEDWEILHTTDTRAENVLIAVKPGGRGDIGETHVAWKYRKALPYVPTVLVYDGRVYFVRDGGVLSSLDAKTGEAIYAERVAGAPGDYYASPVAADGRIYLASLAGKMTVVKAGGTKPEILHQVDFGTRILATPALVDDTMFVRTATHLWAFGP